MDLHAQGGGLLAGERETVPRRDEGLSPQTSRWFGSRAVSIIEHFDDDTLQVSIADDVALLYSYDQVVQERCSTSFALYRHGREPKEKPTKRYCHEGKDLCAP